MWDVFCDNLRYLKRKQFQYAVEMLWRMQPQLNVFDANKKVLPRPVIIIFLWFQKRPMPEDKDVLQEDEILAEW